MLGKLIYKYPSIFSAEYNAECDQLILCLFLLYEMSLGQKSYWYNYLRILPDVEFSCFWPEEILKIGGDVEIISKMAENKKLIKQRWISMKILLQDNLDIFPSDFVDEGLFLNVYA